MQSTDFSPVHYALIGYPLTHSFSEKFFSKKFAEDGINSRYILHEIPTEKSLYEEILSLLYIHPEIRGFNVTIPYKEKIIPLMDKLSPEAECIGAVNVVKVIRTCHNRPYMIGYNTDHIGFLSALRPLLRPHHSAALILGTGGASKAVKYSLEGNGINTLNVSRNPGNGQISYHDLSTDIIKTHNIIVNATPLGTFPKTDTLPDIPYDKLSSSHICYDLVYNPSETMFLRKGKAAGATCINGQQMLYTQAIESYKIWNDKLKK